MRSSIRSRRRIMCSRKRRIHDSLGGRKERKKKEKKELRSGCEFVSKDHLFN